MCAPGGWKVIARRRCNDPIKLPDRVEIWSMMLSHNEDPGITGNKDELLIHVVARTPYAVHR
jgi:hypothetical protein